MVESARQRGRLEGCPGNCSLWAVPDQLLERRQVLRSGVYCERAKRPEPQLPLPIRGVRIRTYTQRGRRLASQHETNLAGIAFPERPANDLPHASDQRVAAEHNRLDPHRIGQETQLPGIADLDAGQEHLDHLIAATVIHQAVYGGREDVAELARSIR